MAMARKLMVMLRAKPLANSGVHFNNVAGIEGSAGPAAA
jgi:hypothetical protein